MAGNTFLMGGHGPYRNDRVRPVRRIGSGWDQHVILQVVGGVDDGYRLRCPVEGLTPEQAAVAMLAPYYGAPSA